MFIKREQIKLIIIAIVFLIIFIAISALKPSQSIYDTRKIYDKIDIGEYSLKVNCYGEGNPTVIFESGLGGTNFVWALVQPKISKITRTFSYDRVRPKNELPRTSLDQVHELHALLDKAKVKGPYIIVAHSIGGYNARLFAATYPKEVSGIVFVDSSHENQNDNFPPDELEKSKEQLANAELNFDELILSANQVKEIRKKDALRNIPIVVLTAVNQGKEPNIERKKTWLNYQNNLATLSDYSKHILVKDSGHYIQNDKPQIVIDAIKDLIDTVRK